MHEVIVLAGAESDLLTTYCWLEAIAPETADRFDSSIHAALERLAEFPESGTVFCGRHRRLLVHGFSHGIFYSIDGLRIVVAAVLDLRQDPQAVLRRLGSE